MSATLYVNNNFDITAQGNEFSGKQGSATDAVGTPFQITATGLVFDVTATLATASVVNVWTSSLALTTWTYLFFWADQDMTIQLIGSASNTKLKVLAKNPFVMGYPKQLAAANTTAISTTEPTFETIASVYLGNYSGNTANYQFSLVN